MAFNATGWQNLTAFGRSAPNLISYQSSVDNLATVSTSGYFNEYINELEIGYIIFVEASDDNQMLRVTSVTTNVAVENYQIANIEDGAVTTPKLANLAVTTAKLDDLSVIATKIGALAVTEAKIDALAVTEAKIGALAVTAAKIATNTITVSQIAGNSIDSRVMLEITDGNTIGVPPGVHKVEMPGGATNTRDIVYSDTVDVTDVHVILRAAGTASDTILVANFTGGDNITNAMDVSGSINSVVRTGLIIAAGENVASGQTLRVTQTDGSGSDSPAVTVYITTVSAS